MLKMEYKTGPWELMAYCDSDYAGDNDTRKSTMGYIMTLNGVTICYKSKGQNIVTLSSTEAEFIAMTEATSDILFIKQIMDFLDMKMKVPVELNVDNTGAKCIAENEYASQRTKHIDVRYLFIREHIEKGEIKIHTVKSERNTSDLFTKNLGHKLFWEHTYKLMEWIENIDAE